jgi:uncharacterized membrane protein
MPEEDAIESPIGEMQPAKHPRIRKVMGLLLTGFAAVIPIAGTIWLMVVIYKVLMRVGDELIKLLLKGLNMMRSGADLATEDFAFYGSNFVRFLIPVFLLLLIGFAVANRPGRKVLHWLDQGMQHVPYVGFIYSKVSLMSNTQALAVGCLALSPETITIPRSTAMSPLCLSPPAQTR